MSHNGPNRQRPWAVIPGTFGTRPGHAPAANCQRVRRGPAGVGRHRRPGGKPGRPGKGDELSWVSFTPRASKKRDRTQAKLNEEELRERKAEFAADKPALMQPTVGLLITKMLRDRKNKQEKDE